jgi:hypothetical protein
MKTVPSTVFRQSLIDSGFAPLLPALDSQVNCPSRDWLENGFSVYLSQIQLPGKAEASDCDKWAMFAASMARFANGESGSSEGVAFAIVWITIFEATFNGIPGPGCHATNAVLLDDGELVAYEPQTQTSASFKDAIDNGDISVDRVLY